MIKSITVINDLSESLTIDLSDGNPEHGLIIKSIDGIGPVKATVNSTNMATRDGAVFSSSRLGTRNVVITFILNNDPRETIEDVRQRTYKYFPNKRWINLFFETDNLYLYCQGVVESNEPSIFSKKEEVKISIICSDPNFYAYSEIIDIVSHSLGEFEFPFYNDIEPGEVDYGIYRYNIVNGYAEIYEIDVEYANKIGVTDIVIPSHIGEYPVIVV